MMENHFSWIPFYKELAKKILDYKNNRSELLKIVKTLDNEDIHYFNTYVNDIHPFVVFGIFNRGTKVENRLRACNQLKDKLNIIAEVPKDFEGIPQLNPQNSWWGDLSNEKDISANWDLFEAALTGSDEIEFSNKFNSVLKQKNAKWTLTIGLYWIAPDKFMPLDAKSRKYLEEIGIDVFNDKDLDAEHYLALIKNIQNSIKSKEIKEKFIYEISFHAYKKDMTNNSLVFDLIDRLLYSRNLIFHGAPGTGKTYLAKEIAKQMDADTEFIQFHPSYDYTDFMEGLRPTGETDRGVDGFKLEDGVFKKFCTRALKNLSDSKKTAKDLQAERTLNEMVDDFIDDSRDFGRIFNMVGGAKFRIIDTSDDRIFVENPKNRELKIPPIPRADIVEVIKNNIQLDVVKSIRLIRNSKVRKQSDSYVFVLCKEIKKLKSKTSRDQAVQRIERKNFLFIIDEINRGEISKIFGELFFSIDPGYRGKVGAVCSQYASMQKDANAFDEVLDIVDSNYGHFFVPENVYIIGTMNDIDRSVENMDLAMRRRFSFEEITAEQSMKMFGDGKAWKTGKKKDDGTDELVDVSSSLSKIRVRMNNLNNAICRDEFHLGKDYQLGGAYFLKFAAYFNGSNESEAFDYLWNYHLKGVIREYLRGIDDIEGTLLKKLENAYKNEADGQKE